MAEGSIDIWRGQDDHIYIDVTDKASGTKFLFIDMAPDVFAKAITGFGFQPVELRFNNLNRIGTVREMKQLNLVPPSPRDEEKAREVVKPYEVDGWIGEVDTLLNPHNANSDGTRRTVFRRWVRQ